MNRKLNTVLFILGATVCNIVVTVASFLLLLTIYLKFIMHSLPETAQAWSFPLIFIASIAIAFVVYRYALKYLLTKIEIEKYFDPIFVRKNSRKK